MHTHASTFIDLLLILTLKALNLWIAGPLFRTVTDGSVLLGSTQGFTATRVLRQAGVQTHLINAGLVGGAVRVKAALRLIYRDCCKW